MVQVYLYLVHSKCKRLPTTSGPEETVVGMCAQPPVQALLLLSSFPFISIVFFPIPQQIFIIDGSVAPEVSKFLQGGLNYLRKPINLAICI